MSIIAGVLGGGQDTQGEALQAGLRAALGPDAPAARVACRSGGGLLGAGSGAWTAEAGALLACIEGAPEWTDADLLALASRGDPAQALLEAWRREGAGLPRLLRGSYALAVLDTAAGAGVLAVDPLGTRPLAWRQDPRSQRLVFASRLDTVRALVGEPAALDLQSVYDYLYAHTVPSPRCIFEGYQKLLPAQSLRIEAGRVQLQFHWRPPYREDAPALGPLAEELLARLEQATRRALPQASCGAFLSGGLDSSTVTGMAARLRPGAVDAYGIGFSAAGYDEMDYARATARHFGVRLHEYYVTPQDVVETVPRMAQWYDEPFGNDSAIPAFHCARMAREAGVEVMLAGDGGDEIFAGNARYAKQKVFGFYDRVPAPLRSALEGVLTALPGTDRIAPLRKARSYVEQARVPLPDRLESYNFLHRTPLTEIFEADFLAAIDPGEPLALAREAYVRADTPEPLKRMLALDIKTTLADNDLRKVVRTCQAAGVQVRFPMLDLELVEFAARVPCSLLLKGLELRWFYKQALGGFLAPETLAKSKHGFGLPTGVWMRSDPALSALATDSLLALRRRRWVRPAYIDFLLERQRGEHANYYGVMVWVLMILEQWLSHRGL